MGSSYYKLNREVFYNTGFLKKYNFLSSQYQNLLPNTIKEVFEWVNFIVANVPAVHAAIDKLSSVCITSLNYTSYDLKELDVDDSNSWKQILERDLKIKEQLKEIAYNFLIYGNQFISVSTPINRTLICDKCYTIYYKKNMAKKQLKPIVEKDKKTGENVLKVISYCDKCKKESKFSVKDNVNASSKDINIIKWPVQRMQIYEDEITGIKKYYYTPDSKQKNLIQKGDPDKIFHLPMDIIISSMLNKSVKFNDDTIIHLRNKKMTGTDTAWGSPLLMSSIPDMIGLMLLRKVNEKIYSDTILPLRGLTPRMQGVDQNAIYNFMSGSDISSKINSIINTWKKDPTAIQFFPIPIEPINAFGEGKALDLTQQIDAYSTMIISSLGIPPEFIKGGLSFSGSGASLRILQNQLIELTNGLEDVTNFVARKVSAILNKNTSVRVKLIPIKLIDDVADKQNMIGLYQSGKISAHTAMNFFDIDYTQEQERIMQEQKNEFIRQREFDDWKANYMTSLEDKIKQESMQQNSNVWNLNQQAIIEEADQKVYELMDMDYGLRKSKLDELAKENPILYAVVKWRMEFLSNKQRTQAANQ